VQRIRQLDLELPGKRADLRGRVAAGQSEQRDADALAPLFQLPESLPGPLLPCVKAELVGGHVGEERSDLGEDFGGLLAPLSGFDALLVAPLDLPGDGLAAEGGERGDAGRDRGT
jgi:hypothetical protein